MATHCFARYALRTTDAEAATAFYDAVLGHHGDWVYPLHEQAIARGARPHWLGHIDVADPEASAAPLFARGAERSGVRPDGVIVLRDPGGAILAFGGASGVSTAGVVWHVLNTRDAERAGQSYAELLGWSLGERIDLGEDGNVRAFAWSAGSPSIGAIADVIGRPGVHPHWLFFFGVDSVEGAASAVRDRGGVVIGPKALPDGTRYALCEDPQGAAFGLMQRR